MRTIRSGAVWLAVVLLGAAIALAVWEPFTAARVVAPVERHYDSVIARDRFGVPHIFGKTDPDVAYGVAYAHAEDDFATLQEAVAMARGRLGAMTGADGAKVDYTLALLGARETAQRDYDKQPADVRALLDAYASGLNAYARRHPGEIRLARLFPANGEDIATGFVLRTPFFFGLDQTLGALSGDKPLPAEIAGAVPDSPDPTARPATGEAMPNGSNAFVVAPKRSADGFTRVISNSHQPWSGPVAWYELSVQSGTGWHFSGATFPGVPFPVLGHNEHLGWTNTVNRPDLTDVYKLVRNQAGTEYRFDGKWLPLEARRVWLKVRFGPFVLPIPKMVYRAVQGPVIVNKSGAFAIRYAGADQLRMVEEYYRLTRARDFGEWQKALALQGVPATNFLYGDAAGNIAYVYNASFPNRKPGFDYRHLLRGDTSRDLAAGTVPFAQVPRNVNPASGFLANANNTPFQAAGAGSELKPGNYSPLLGIETDTTNRGTRAVELLGADPSISAEDLLRIKFDTGVSKLSWAAKWYGDVARVNPKGDAQLKQAIGLLRGWNWDFDGHHSGQALAAILLRTGQKWHYQRRPELDPRDALAKAAAYLQTHFGTLDPPLGTLLRLRHGSADLPLDGAPDVLRAASTWDEADDGRLVVKHGDSFVMVMAWDKAGRVASESIQPYGAATTRPESPHYADQAPLFAAHRFKPVLFWRDDLRKNVERVYRPTPDPSLPGRGGECEPTRSNEGRGSVCYRPSAAIASHYSSSFRRHSQGISMTVKLLALSGVALATFVTPSFAQTAPKPVPVADLVKQVDIPYSEFRLPNGLRVIVNTDRKAPVVAVSVWYNVGSKFEPKGKTGFAHLFEHLMFNGSENAPKDYFTYTKAMGATDLNGTTYFDRTNYFETVPVAALDRALFLESDRMGYLLGAITPAVVDEQRGVVQNEKRQGDNQPYGLVQYKQTEALFPATHPYGHTTIGAMADLDSASVEDVKNWFRGHYGPNNAVLVLSGDVDVATAKTLVTKYFGAIPKGPESVVPTADVPTLAAPKSEVIKDRVANTRIYRMWAVPGINNPDAVALDVAAGVLGGLSSSRLDNALVRKEKLAVRVSANNESFAQVGMFVVSADARPGVDPALVAKRLDEIIADVIANGPTADEVARVATRDAAGRIAGLESTGGFGGKAVALAEGALYENDPGFYKKQLAELAAQTPARVKAASAKWLTRPVYALTVIPGARDAYVEATPPVKVAAAPEPEFKGTRGALPPVGTLSSLVFPKVEHAKLKNGIELIYAYRNAVPITQASISFDAGVAADVPGKLGTQGLTLDMLDEGTTTRDSIAIAEAKERLGASITSGSAPDRTIVGMFTPSANLAASTELLADIVRHPKFDPAEVARLKNQQLSRISAELTSPQGLALRVFPKLVYGAAYPYAKALGSGDAKAVAALTRDDLVAFQQAWIRPDKAKIFVVSDRPLAEIKAAFDARFGDWTPTGPAGVKDFSVKTAPSAPKIVLIDRPDSPQSFIIAGAPTALVGTDDLLPLETANDTLGGDFLSRVNMDLREARHWSYGVNGSFRRAQYATPYLLGTGVQADKTGESIASLRTDFADFVTTKGITSDEFDRTITDAISSLPGNFETSGAVLGALQSNDLYRRPDDYYATLPQKYRGFTAGQLDAAARAALDPKRFVWIVVGDAAKVRGQLDSIGLPVEVIPAASVADVR